MRLNLSYDPFTANGLGRTFKIGLRSRFWSPAGLENSKDAGHHPASFLWTILRWQDAYAVISVASPFADRISIQYPSGSFTKARPFIRPSSGRFTKSAPSFSNRAHAA